jgi:AcrR family transcriptional regulator
MPKIVDAGEQRRAIRRAAHRVFARRGVKGVGLAHVAAEAGVGRSSLYHYYRDKSALVRDLARDLLREEEALFASAARGEGSAMERIERLLLALDDMFESWSAVGKLLLDLRTIDRRQFRDFFRRARGHLASVIAEGQRDGEIDAAIDPELAAATIIGAIDGLLLQYFVEPAAFAGLDSATARVVSLFRKALRP